MRERINVSGGNDTVRTSSTPVIVGSQRPASNSLTAKPVAKLVVATQCAIIHRRLKAVHENFLPFSPLGRLLVLTGRCQFKAR